MFATHEALTFLLVPCLNACTTAQCRTSSPKKKKKKGTTASAFTECLQYLDVFGSTLPEHMPTGPKRQELGGGETTGNYHHYGPASLGRGA
jgi:hypothetical protein